MKHSKPERCKRLIFLSVGDVMNNGIEKPLSGIALGAGISSLIALIAGWAVKLSAFSIILATGFSLLVGIVFGSWPAHQASLLNPIEALRYE